MDATSQPSVQCRRCWTAGPYSNGKGFDAAKDVGLVAIEDLKVKKSGRHGRGAGNPAQMETLERSAILTSPSWLVNVSV
jgi:hypothetical protein